jgi:hypothetical protein
MDTTEVRDICTQRFAGWTERLVASHATPVLLLGIGHDHNSGQLNVITMEDVPDEQLKLFLAATLRELMERRK